MVVLKQLDHLQVVELYGIIQGNVAPPVRNKDHGQAGRTREYHSSTYMHGGHRAVGRLGHPPSLRSYSPVLDEGIHFASLDQKLDNFNVS